MSQIGRAIGEAHSRKGTTLYSCAVGRKWKGFTMELQSSSKPGKVGVVLSICRNTLEPKNGERTRRALRLCMILTGISLLVPTVVPKWLISKLLGKEPLPCVAEASFGPSGGNVMEGLVVSVKLPSQLVVEIQGMAGKFPRWRVMGNKTATPNSSAFPISGL